MGPALAELARRRRQALSPPAPFDGTSPTQDVRTLILSWLEGMAVPSVRRTAPVVKTMWVSEHRRSRQDQLMQGRGLHEHGRGLLAAFSSRVHAVARNVLLGRTREPLATPTHRRGYLCPVVFAERLRRADAIEPIDLAQALLRLGDEGRDRALELLSETPIAAATYARWALGGPDEPAPDPLLLAAASAARSIPEVRWKLRTAQRRYENRNVGGFRDAFTTVELRADPAPEGIAAGSLVAALLDTSQVIDGPSDYEAVTPSLVASMWPAFPDATYARAARLIADDYDEGRHHALASFVERLIEPGPELREAGATLLGVALAAPSSDVRALGVEALATALAGGRLGEQARAQLGALLETQVIVTSRWVAGLKSAAARSSRHRGQARELIESWMATGVAAHFDRDLGALLELVYQSAVKDEARVVDPRALRFLASVEGKSAAARTARKLREL